jgi:hypothetical protein
MSNVDVVWISSVGIVRLQKMRQQGRRFMGVVLGCGEREGVGWP